MIAVIFIVFDPLLVVEVVHVCIKDLEGERRRKDVKPPGWISMLIEGPAAPTFISPNPNILSWLYSSGQYGSTTHGHSNGGSRVFADKHNGYASAEPAVQGLNADQEQYGTIPQLPTIVHHTGSLEECHRKRSLCSSASYEQLIGITPVV